MEPGEVTPEPNAETDRAGIFQRLADEREFRDQYVPERSDFVREQSDIASSSTNFARSEFFAEESELETISNTVDQIREKIVELGKTMDSHPDDPMSPDDPAAATSLWDIRNGFDTVVDRTVLPEELGELSTRILLKRTQRNGNTYTTTEIQMDGSGNYRFVLQEDNRDSAEAPLIYRSSRLTSSLPIKDSMTDAESRIISDTLKTYWKVLEQAQKGEDEEY